MNDDLPIVATNVGDNYKLVRDRVNGYLETMGDVDALAKAIVTLYCDSDLRNRMVKAGKKNLEENYSVEVFELVSLPLV